jgi:uncharacterized protein YjbI with pentapeptide repeats
LPSGWVLRNGYLLGKTANLGGENLVGLNLSNLDLRWAQLGGIRSNNVIANPMPLLPEKWRLVGGMLIGPGANLSGADLTGVRSLAGTDLEWVRSGNVLGNPDMPSGWLLRKGYIIGAGANLTDADLSDLDLSGMILTGTTFTGANLSNTNMTGTKINQTNFSGANLSGADLTGSFLQQVKSGGVIGEAELPTGWLLRNGFLIGRSAYLTDADLSRQDLTGADLTGANLTGANLTGATLTGVRSWGTIGIPTLPTGWILRNGFLIGPGANLRDANLAGAALGNTDLTGANLTGVQSGNITGTPTLPTGWKLSRGYLIGPGANLYGADLTGGNLTGVKSGNITGTPTLPTGWKLINGYLIGPGANLTDAILNGANLSSANLDEVVSGNTSGTPTLPTGWKLSVGYLVGPSANLTGANLRGANLSGTNLARANLEGVRSGEITGTTTLPEGWLLQAGYLVGPRANLEEAVLIGTNLNGANLTNATLTGVTSGNITGTPTLPTNWTLRNGYLIGPGANLNGANLTNATLTGANLNGANLTNATLSGVTSGNITGTPTLPTNWTLRNGYLIGPGANLTGADLSSIDLSGFFIGKIAGNPILPKAWKNAKGYLVGAGANLNGADLSGADLRNIDFGTAQLFGTNLDNANLSSAILTEVVSASIIGNPILPTGWKISNGVITGAKQFVTRPQIRLIGVNIVGSTLTADAGIWSPTPAKITYEWFKDGSLLPGFKSKTYVISPDDLRSRIYVRATFERPGFNKTIRTSSDSGEIREGVFSAVSAPSISGKSVVGQILKASVKPWKPGPNIVFYWLADGVDLGLSGNSFQVTASVIGKKISVRAVGKKTGYHDSIVLSQESSPVTLPAIAKSSDPKISIKSGSKLKPGTTLTTKVGEWSIGVSFSYQWLRNGTPIESATGVDYLISTDDSTKKITVKIVGSLPGFQTSTKTSPISLMILK